MNWRDWIRVLVAGSMLTLLHAKALRNDEAAQQAIQQTLAQGSLMAAWTAA